MSFYHVLAVFFLGITGCGQPDDGRDGRDGVSPEPAPPIKPDDGQDAVVSGQSCSHVWQHEAPGRGYRLLYNLLTLSDKSKLVTFNYVYFNEEGSEFFNQISGVMLEADPAYATARLENEMWKVEMVSETSAKILYKPLAQEKVLECLRK